MFSFISKKISDKKFCTWDIICDIIYEILQNLFLMVVVPLVAFSLFLNFLNIFKDNF
jgi:hypothetical protein